MRSFPLLALSTTLLACAIPAAAQEPRTGRIEGVVYDSVARRPLAGASVMVVQLAPAPPQFFIAITDTRGRYRVDSLVAGRFGVGFTSGWLDSLELTLPQRELTLAAGERQMLDLGTPSRSRLFAAACPGVPSSPGSGALIGQVRDADTDEPLAGATVALRWHDLVLDRETMRATNVPREAGIVTDSLGAYRACGVPTDVHVVLQVQHAERAGTAVRSMVREETGIMLQNLSFTAAASRAFDAVLDAAGDSALAPLTGTAALNGRVRDIAGLPVVDAIVRVAGAEGVARSDRDGQFALGGLPAGTQLLEVRRLGYLLGQIAVELRSGRALTQEVLLAKVVTLDSIRILAQRVRYQEFERRASRGGGGGTMLRREQLDKMHLVETGDIFRRVLGFSVTGSGLDAKLRSTRGAISLLQGCTPNVVIDGMQHQEINLVQPTDLAAIEVYRGPAGAPPEYDSACGVVVIWTKR